MTYKNLLLERKVQEDTITTCEESGLLQFVGNDTAHFIMKDLDGNEIGHKIRQIGAEIKSRTNKGGSQGYFYQGEIHERTHEVWIVEGEIDYLTILPYAQQSNALVIGLPGVNKLKDLLLGLEQKKVKRIIIMGDNDEVMNQEIDKVINYIDQVGNIIDSHCIYDGRRYLTETKQKDINEYVCNISSEVDLNYLENTNDLWSIKANALKKGSSISGGQVNPIYAECLSSGKHGNKLVHVDEYAERFKKDYSIANINGFFYMYDYKNEIWIPKTEKQIQGTIRQQLRNDQIGGLSEKDSSGVLKSLELSCINEIQKTSTQSEYVINLHDGFYNVIDNKLTPYHKSDMVTFKHPYKSDILQKRNKPEQFISFLHSILEGYSDKDSIVDFFQERGGYCLAGFTKFEKGILLYGKGGNGKGVYMRVNEQVFGKENVAVFQLNTIDKEINRYKLLDKMVAIDYDIPNNSQLDQSIIKLIVSGEIIEMRKLYHQPIEVNLTCKVMMAANKIPYLTNEDDSIGRRLDIIELRKSFTGKERDPELFAKIIKEKESIFAWYVVGLQRLIKRGGFKKTKEIEENKERYLKEQDTVYGFFQEGDFVQEFGILTPISEVRDAYNNFCKENKYMPIAGRRYQDGIEKHFKAKKIKKSDGRYWEGIGYRDKRLGQNDKNDKNDKNDNEL